MLGQYPQAKTCVIFVIVYPERFAVNTFPAESIAIPRGDIPVAPKITDAPLDVPGVILVTLFDPSLAVYTLPAASTTIPPGLVPVLAQLSAESAEGPPNRVIFDTVFEPLLAVNT